MAKSTQAKGNRKVALVAIADSNYLSRCSTMVESAEIAHLATVLALDDGVKPIQNWFPELRLESFRSYIGSRPYLAKQISQRSTSEQIFSVGPSFLMSQSASVTPEGWLVYADSDLFFFEPLQSYLESLPPCNVVITPHRHYFWNKRRLAKYGKYNVGLVAFRNNEEGLRALRFWADSCLEWCYDRHEDGRYADQKYLEQFSSVTSGVLVDNSIGANLAPWNSFLKRITVGNSGEIFVGRRKLNYFHAQGLKQKNGRWILGHLNYLSFAGPRLKRIVYRPYLDKLEEWAQKPGFEGFGSSRSATTLVGRFAATMTYGLSVFLGQTVKVVNRKSGAQL